MLLISLLFSVQVYSQQPDETFLKQNLMFRNAVSLKDYSLKGKVQRMEISRTDADFGSSSDYVFHFSETGLITKTETIINKDRKNMVTRFFHYSNNKLDSITNKDGTSKEEFFYDDLGRLTKKVSYGSYEENKNSISEVEHYSYDNENFIIKAEKDYAQMVTTALYDKQGRFIRTNMYSISAPEVVDVMEYSYSDKSEKSVWKQNGKPVFTTTIYYKEDKIIDAIEITDVNGNKTTTDVQFTFDKKGNIITETSLENGRKSSEAIFKIIYYTE